MLRLLSKLKEDLAHNGVEVVNSTLQGDTIKLMCSANGRRDTELNAYIIPDGDGFNFYTQAPSEGKSDEIKLTEEQIVPTIISKVDPNKPYVVENQEATETTEDLQDEIKIEVEDGVFDTKVVKHNSYNNSRYAYSSKYGKMGTIVEIRVKNTRQINGIPIDKVNDINSLLTYLDESVSTINKGYHYIDVERGSKKPNEPCLILYGPEGNKVEVIYTDKPKLWVDKNGGSSGYKYLDSFDKVPTYIWKFLGIDISKHKLG